MVTGTFLSSLKHLEAAFHHFSTPLAIPQFGFCASRMDFVKSPSGTYVHDDESFFPIDGKGWNDTRIGFLDQLIGASPIKKMGDGSGS